MVTKRVEKDSEGGDSGLFSRNYLGFCLRDRLKSGNAAARVAGTMTKKKPETTE
jgi:hypothetical protein